MIPLPGDVYYTPGPFSELGLVISTIAKHRSRRGIGYTWHVTALVTKLPVRQHSHSVTITERYLEADKAGNLTYSKVIIRPEQSNSTARGDKQ